MKTIQEFLQEKVKPANFKDILTVGKINLFEVEDPMGGGNAGVVTNNSKAEVTDPLGGGNPFGGDGELSMDGLPGDPGTGPADSNQGGVENAETDEGAEDQEDDHEDDPDWTKGVKDTDNVMLKDKPAGESIYDGESVLKSINAVRASKSPEELKSMDEVQKALELIVNGKKLKIEDVSFEDPDDAMELISAIEEPLDIKLRNYIDLKIKQPIIAYRDQNKAEIAKMAADNDKARDTIDAMNKQEK